MVDSRKTKAELISELSALREQLASFQGSLSTGHGGHLLSQQSVIDALPIFISYLDPDHRYRLVNKLYETWLNKPREQIVGQHLRSIVGDDRYAQARPYLEQAFTGLAVSYETILHEQDGPHTYEVYNAPDIVDGSIQGLFVLVTDITARKKAEKELLKKEKLLSNAQRIAHLASVDWDPVNDQATVSGEHDEIFGVGSEYFDKNAAERFLRLVHPDDREFVKSQLDHAINDKASVYYDYRIIRSDGAVRNMHDRFEVICNEHGKVVRLIGTSQDISERKEIENRLRQEKDFAEGLIDTAQAIVLVLDTDAHIMRFNPYMETITGYKLEEVKGKDWFSTFLPRKDHQRIRALFENAIKDNKTEGNINPILTRDGRERIIEWYDTTLHDSDNIIIGLLAIGQDITERVATQSALREERNLLQTVLAATPDFQVFKDRESIYRSVNNAFCKFIKKDEDEIIGKSDYDLFPEAEATIYRRDDARVMDTGVALLQDEHVSTPDSEKVWLQVAKTPVHTTNGEVSGILVSVRDISQRKQMEEDLLLFKSIIESSNEAIAVTDPQGQFIYVNPAHERLFGIPFSKACELNYRDYFPAESLEALSQTVAPKLACGESWEGQLQAKDSKGRLFPLWERADSLHDSEGNMLYAFGLMHDISEQQDAEQALIRAKEEAEDANKAKSLFLSRMSHELRTPLNSILGFAQLLGTEGSVDIKEKRNEYVDQIQKCGWHLLELINDVLDLSRIEARKVDMLIEDVDVNERICDSIDIVSPLADDRNIRISYPADMACQDLYVRADALRLKQVLLNLLSNAVKYNRRGGSVTVRCYQTDADRLRVSISDTGSGISEEDFPGLFEPFSRLYLNTYAKEGTGIGLSISKHLIELMGGTIGVDSDPGKGSTFWIDLEASQLDEHESGTQTDEASTPVEQTNNEYDLLYIEDNPAHIKLMQAIIDSTTDYRLRMAHTPRLGLELAFSRPPDLILLDICLPGMDGFEVLEKLQKHESTQHIPVIALSANAMPKEIEKGLRAGFRRYIIKPINIEKFLRTMEELLQGDTT